MGSEGVKGPSFEVRLREPNQTIMQQWKRLRKGKMYLAHLKVLMI